MLQLTQALRFEPAHDSALARFLLMRGQPLLLLAMRFKHVFAAVRHPVLIGHTLFWHLKANMHQPEVTVRYGLLLEAYLSVCGPQLQEFVAQVQLMGALTAVGEMAKQTPPPERRVSIIQSLPSFQYRGIKNLTLRSTGEGPTGTGAGKDATHPTPAAQPADAGISYLRLYFAHCLLPRCLA
jgi:hypothetical protein